MQRCRLSFFSISHILVRFCIIWPTFLWHRCVSSRATANMFMRLTRRLTPRESHRATTTGDHYEKACTRRCYRCNCVLFLCRWPERTGRRNRTGHRHHLDLVLFVRCCLDHPGAAAGRRGCRCCFLISALQFDFKRWPTRPPFLFDPFPNFDSGDVSAAAFRNGPNSL